jgi:hypothetical protein
MRTNLAIPVFALAVGGCGGSHASERVAAVTIDPGPALPEEPEPEEPPQLEPIATDDFVEPSRTAPSPARWAAALSHDEKLRIRPGLDARTVADAPGMLIAAGPFGGRFGEGEVLDLQVTMVPNRCYTIVAVSLGIGELDAAVLVDAATFPGMPSVVMAQDTSTGPDATVGAGGNCFKWALPIAAPVLVRLTAVKGAGIAAAAVLAK